MPRHSCERGVIAQVVSESAGITRGAEILVPYAGNGVMAFVALACDAMVDCYDDRPEHHHWMCRHPFRAVINGTVAVLRPSGRYDRVLCYAPDIPHRLIGTELSCALDALRPGGRMVAVLPASVLDEQDDAGLRSLLTQAHHMGWMGRVPTVRRSDGADDRLIIVTINVTEVGHA